MSGVKISQLPAIVTPALTDIFPVVQSGTTYKETITQLASLVSSNISANSVTNAMLAPMGANTIKGNNTGGSTNPADLTVAQVKTMLSIATGQILGTNTNDSATAGNVGQYISSSVLAGAAVPLTTVTYANVTSIALTAGDWDVRGLVANVPDAATVTVFLDACISTTSATPPTIAAENNYSRDVVSNAAGISTVINVGPMRISLAAPTTVYLVAQADFSVNTNAAFGFIGARRVR